MSSAANYIARLTLMTTPVVHHRSNGLFQTQPSQRERELMHIDIVAITDIIISVQHLK